MYAEAEQQAASFKEFLQEQIESGQYTGGEVAPRKVRERRQRNAHDRDMSQGAYGDSLEADDNMGWG